MTVQTIIGDCRDVLATLPAASVHCCVTSPPYFGLRDYGMGAQIGLEATPEAFIAELVAVFREVRRVLRDDGTLWVNIGDSYSNAGTCQGDRDGAVSGDVDEHRKVSAGYRARVEGLKNKDLIGIPWMLAFALRADGWYLRHEIIWHKPNPMPESVTDRCTKAHEYVFLLSKSAKYFYDAGAIAEAGVYPAGTKGAKGSSERFNTPGVNSRPPEYKIYSGTRNKRSVWTVATQPFSGAHFATFPPALIEPCILAGCPAGGTVLDPFGGAGTTGLVADRLQRSAILIELNPAYAAIASDRITDDAPLFGAAL